MIISTNEKLRMLEAIKQNGTEKSAYESIGISSTTFRKVLKKDPVFSQKVEEAKVIHRYRKPQEQRDKAIVAIIDRIENGNRTKKITRYRGSVTRYDRQGEIVYTDVYDRSTEVEIVSPVSPALLAKFLPPTLDEAVRVVLSHGYRVIDPTIKEQQTSNKGLPDNVADVILGDIIGEKSES